MVTGAVELMRVDVQSEMQGLKDVSDCYHTDLIATSDRAKIEGAVHFENPSRKRGSTLPRNA